jgi:DNA-binding FadR family transcriptional regulator
LALATKGSTSRTAIGEATTALTDKGLIVSKQGRDMIVRCPRFPRMGHARSDYPRGAVAARGRARLSRNLSEIRSLLEGA